MPRHVTWGRIVLALLVLGCFVSYRWLMRQEPLNSDDMSLFQVSANAASGDHWLWQSSPGPRLSHQALRVGILPFSVPAILLFGPTYLAYYAVPLVFSLCGFTLTWYIMHREIHPGFALVFAGIHLVLPFEVISSSAFLVDLPGAVFTLLCLVLLATLAQPDGLSSLAKAVRGGLVGLVAVEAYLLRTNLPVLLVPAFLFFVWSKKTRGMSLWASGALAVGICCEQLYYIWKGLGWGFRWVAVRGALDNYSPFLPVYTLPEFVLREFTFLFRYFHGWPDGVFAVLFYVTALVAHLVIFFRSRSALLRALALTGLTTWGIFSFAMYEMIGDSIRALAPPLFRYFQIFFYTTIVSLCWATYQLYQTTCEWLSASLAQSSGSQVFLARIALVCLGCIVFAVGGMSARLSSKYALSRLLNPGGELQETLRAIDELAETAGDAPLPIHITPYSLRLFSLFRGPWSSPPVLWKPSYPQQLATLTHNQVPEVVLRDTWREVSLLRYRQGQVGRQYEKVLGTLRGALWDHYEPVSVTQRFALYRASSASSVLLPNGNFQNAESATHRVPFWHFPAIVSALVRRSAEDHLQLTLPAESAPFYVSSGDPPGFSLPPTDTQAYRLPPGPSSTFRIHVTFDAPVTASVFILQYDAERRIDDHHAVLHSGENYITVRPHAAAQSYRVALRFSVESSRSETSLTFIEVSVQSNPE